MKFDLDQLVSDCRNAVKESSPQAASPTLANPARDGPPKRSQRIEGRPPAVEENAKTRASGHYAAVSSFPGPICCGY